MGGGFFAFGTRQRQELLQLAQRFGAIAFSNYDLGAENIGAKGEFCIAEGQGNIPTFFQY